MLIHDVPTAPVRPGTDRAELARLMADLAEDPGAVIAFVEAFGDRLAGVVRRLLRELGRGDLAADADEVDGLVIDVALLLQEDAASWKPDGALPWSWAWAAIRKLIADAIGHARADLELESFDVGACAPAAPTEDLDFDRVANRFAILGLLREALVEIPCSDRDRRVYVEYRIQSSMGDPSPARTVAAEFGLNPSNVRQIDRRVRLKLQELCHTDRRFGSLRELPWVTAGRDPVDHEICDAA